MPEVEVGEINGFFSHVTVAGIKLTGSLKVGDRIHIKGHTTDMELLVDAMEINRVRVPEARAGQDIGIKVPERVRRGDKVYKITA